MAANNTDKNTIIKCTSLVVLVLQNTSLVLFMKFAMGSDRTAFLKTVTVFFGEIFKLCASVALVMCEEKSVRKGLYTIYDQFVNHWRDALKVLIPAAIYTVQNFLLYVSVGLLPSATFMVTYQLKILTTAIFTRVVLKRRLSTAQWLSLVALFAGIATVQYDFKLSEDREKAAAKELLTTVNGTTTSPVVAMTADPTLFGIQKSYLGFIAVLIACCMSGFAGIYFEKILKGSEVSIWVRNIQLAFPSIFFALIFAFVKDHNMIFSDGAAPTAIVSKMLTGFDWAVWVTVAINAFGGLVVAVVIKFADNILKAFATSFAIVLNCVLSYFLFNFNPTKLFVLGAAAVIGAIFFYSRFPYRKKDVLPVAQSEEEANHQELKQINDSSRLCDDDDIKQA